MAHVQFFGVLSTVTSLYSESIYVRRFAKIFICWPAQYPAYDLITVLSGNNTKNGLSLTQYTDFSKAFFTNKMSQACTVR